MSEADKKYKIEIFFNNGTEHSAEVSEETKYNLVRMIEEKRVERVSFNDYIENEVCIININNVNIIKLSEE